jgi:hypothetical protein
MRIALNFHNRTQHLIVGVGLFAFTSIYLVHPLDNPTFRCVKSNTTDIPDFFEKSGIFCKTGVLDNLLIGYQTANCFEQSSGFI